MIRKINGRWILYSTDGKKILGKHDSRADAVSQEAAILAKQKRFK